MDWLIGVTLAGGGLVLAGIAYPELAKTKLGWKIGAWTGGTIWLLWYGFGALAYLAGMWSLMGWVGALLAIPSAMLIGFGVTQVLGKHVQIIAPLGTILSNIWFHQ